MAVFPILRLDLSKIINRKEEKTVGQRDGQRKNEGYEVTELNIAANEAY